MNSSSRGRARVRVLAVHTTEGIMRAADLRAWKSWPGSSHASADETGALMGPAEGFVPYHLASWTLRSGNAWSENIELCGFARWTRAEWLSRPKLLEAAARWLAERSAARGIPLVKLTPAQYRAGASGVIGHVDHTVGYSDGTHTDPGKSFPWDVVITRAQAIRSGSGSPAASIPPEDDMTGPATISAIATATAAQTRDEILYTRDTSPAGANRNLGDKLNQLIITQAQQGATISAMAQLLAAQQPVSAEQIETTIREAIADATVRVTVDVHGADGQPTT